jgi:CelD/BcsL family acetyltransferase involved in cellulose biosynthesis
MPYEVRVLSGERELTAVAPAWEALRAAKDRPHVEQHLDWLLADARATREQRRRPMAIALFEGGNLAAIAPFSLRDWSWRCSLGYAKVASFPVALADLAGDDFVVPDDRDPPAAGAEPASQAGEDGPRAPSGPRARRTEALLEAIARADVPFDLFYLESLRVGSPLWEAIQRSAALRERFHVYVPTPPSAHWLIRLPESFEAYVSKFGGKTRRKLTYAARKLEQEAGGAIHVECIRAREDVPRFVRAVQTLSERSWQGTRLGQVVRATSEQIDALSLQAERGWLRSYLLSCKGEPVAFVLGSQEGGVYYYERIGYDPKWADFSPGKVLLLRLLEDLFKPHTGAERPRWLDFGSGDSEYKQLFGNEQYAEAHVYLVRKTPYMTAALSVHAGLNRVESTARKLLVRYGLREKVRHLLRGRWPGGKSASPPAPGGTEDAARAPKPTSAANAARRAPAAANARKSEDPPASAAE